jgi:hypothetical protein
MSKKCRLLHNNELQELYASSNIVMVLSYILEATLYKEQKKILVGCLNGLTDL